MKTLRQRIEEGPIPINEALRYAGFLAEALRKLHDDGSEHGSVTPDGIVLTAVGLDVLPAGPGAIRITSYTAPEVAVGSNPADARSDIFSFGAIFFEILTGRKAFDGVNESAVVTSILGSPAPPFGSTAVDRLLAGCLAKDPTVRWQHIEDVQLELKFLMPHSNRAFRHRQRVPKLQEQLRVSTAGRRAAALSAAPRIESPNAAMGSELAQFEARINAKLESHEKAVADMRRSTAEAVAALRQQFSAFGGQPDMAREEVADGALTIDLIAARIQHGIDNLSSRMAFLEQNHGVTSESLIRFETGLGSLREQFSDLHTQIAGDLHEFESSLKAQSTAIDSARTAMAQTDDLVERVVEALESLQSTVLERSEDGVMALT